MKTIQINREKLHTLYGGCYESMNLVFSEFIGSYDEMKKNLTSAFQSGNLSSFKRVLHFHGPSFTYLGFPDIAILFKNLERKSEGAVTYFEIVPDFNELMQAVETSYWQITSEASSYKQAI